MNYSDFIKMFENIISLAEKAKDFKLTTAISELSVKTLKLVQENADLKDKLNKQKDNDDFAKNLRITDEGYYYKDEAIPYCIRCWDADKKRIHLQKDGYGTWICPEEIYQRRK